MVVHYCIADSSSKQLNVKFIQFYAYKQWFYKIKMLEHQITQTEKVIEGMTDDEISINDKNSYELFLMTEIVNLYYHISESLFTLTLAYLHMRVPWIQIGALRNSALCDFIRDFVIAGKLTKDHYRTVFYFNLQEPQEERVEFQQSLEFIDAFMIKNGQKFLSELERYNEFKHGSKIFTSIQRIAITPDNVENPKTSLIGEGITQTYLKTNLIKKDGKEVYNQIEEISISIDYKQYLRLTKICYRLIYNLIEIRKQSERKKNGESINVGMFYQENIDDLFKENFGTLHRFSIKHPTNN